jgi:hypothetical protein
MRKNTIIPLSDAELDFVTGGASDTNTGGTGGIGGNGGFTGNGNNGTVSGNGANFSSGTQNARGGSARGGDVRIRGT